MDILLFSATTIIYCIGLNIKGNTNREGHRKSNLLTLLGVLLCVGMLAYFKYLNFFINGFSSLFEALGIKTTISSFNIVIPAGISFFTFKLISYIIEVSRGNIKAEKDFITFSTYVAFFPTIMSGPIDRPKQFLKQLSKTRTINYGYISIGIKRIIWGMFCKMCVADVLVSYTDAVFNNIAVHNLSSILLATLLYTFQIYADFNGYSNIAIGIALILGIKVTENFNHPYFASSVTDFWRRWHISLSSWIRDYIYIPLGGNRKGRVRTYINQLTSMTICGLWHGASLNFVVWGAIHGFWLCIHKFFSQTILGHDKHYYPRGVNRVLSIISTFIIVSLTWQLFRINNIDNMGKIFMKLEEGFPPPPFLNDPNVFTFGIISTSLMIIKDYKDEFNTKILTLKNTWIRLTLWACLVSYIILFGALNGKTFIYFQF